jgi:hypothetical protein
MSLKPLLDHLRAHSPAAGLASLAKQSECASALFATRAGHCKSPEEFLRGMRLPALLALLRLR